MVQSKASKTSFLGLGLASLCLMAAAWTFHTANAGAQDGLFLQTEPQIGVSATRH